MEDLKKYFISTDGEYKEGQVFVFEQSIKSESIRSATLYITALGVYEAEIDRVKIGKQIFAPGYTYYLRDLFYQKYDITEMLKTDSKLRVYLGQGWYCGRFTFDNKTQIYGEKQAVSWIVEITDDNGQVRKITSRDGDVVRLESPYEYAGFYDGEIYDDLPALKEVGRPVLFEGQIPDHLEETYSQVQLQEKMEVASVSKQDDKTIIDFGQNFAGMIFIDKAKIPAGVTITLRHGEVLDKDGNLYTDNLRKAKATIVYKSSGGSGTYIPRFTYMGFRYVELTGMDYVDGMLCAHALYNEMERTGQFSCDNEMVQKLYNNTVWGMKSNYVEVPTDCPQRDERMGYTGDGHVFARTGAYHFNTELFWKKFLKDITYSQMDNTEGYIGSTVPATGPAGVGFLSMLGWGNAVTLIPEMLYDMYGNRDYLINQYDSIKKFVDAEIAHMKKGLWNGPSLGDWLMPGKSMAWAVMHNYPVSNAFIIHDLQVLYKLAESLDKTEDAAIYREKYETSKAAYIKKFISKTGKVSGNYQGAYIMALKYVVTDPEIREKLVNRLIKLLEKNGIDTGFFSTPFLLPMLVDAGKKDLAFDLLLSDKCPSWGYQIKNGATTMWERWDSLKEDGTVNDAKVSSDNMVSFNHYSFGSVAQFYYEYILGIKPLKPGFEEVQIAPVTDERLAHVSGSYESHHGKIAVEWTNKKGNVELIINTPVATKVVLEDGQIFEVQAGEWRYEYVC